MPLTNAQHDAIMRILVERQLHNRSEQDARVKEACTRFPRLAEISSEIASVSLDSARKALASGGTPDPDYQDKISALREERRALLLAGGYPEDYLEMHYTCPLCRDTGYVDNRKCSCFRQLELSYLYAGSSGTDLPEHEDFTSFSLDYYTDERDEISSLTHRELALAARNISAGFVRDFSTSFQNLFFYGDTGVGKTFLSNCIAHELIRRGINVVYLTSYDLFQILAQSAFDRDEEQDARADRIFSCDLLIIDDLGTELTNSFVSSQLFVCVNERILKKKPTIISTNLSLEQVRETYSERTFSRILSAYRMIRLCGRDIRIQKKLSGES